MTYICLMSNADITSFAYPCFCNQAVIFIRTNLFYKPHYLLTTELLGCLNSKGGIELPVNNWYLERAVSVGCVLEQKAFCTPMIAARNACSQMLSISEEVIT